MSTRLLYKAFFGRRYAPIVGVTLAICGLYGGYLLWFICQRYLPGPDAAAWHLAFLIGWMLCSFLALGRIPDALFTNRRLCAVRWLPVPGTLLVRLTLGHLLLLQGGIIALVFWGFFLHAEGGRASLLRLMLACLLCAALADLVIYLLALLVSLFHQRVQLLLPDATLLTLVLLSVSCAINTIASTAYSSDASRHCYDFLPIDGARLFLWKVLVSAFWGLPLVVLVWLVSVCVVRPAFAESLLLLLYALTSALLCAALGVWLDQRMPRNPQSTNELLHGNLSKVCVLAAALTLSISLCRVAESHALIAAVTLNLVLVLFSAARFFLRKEDHT